MRWLPVLAVILLLPRTGFTEGEEGGAKAPIPDLVADTLREDIETASYYELLAWCRELGLDDTGTRQALADRLLAHYRVQPAAQGAGKAAKRILTISSARAADYFTIQEIDENYVLLQGDVLVELKEGDATHRIRAQKILLNQTANLLTAEGDIEYTFQKGDRRDMFHGEKITFDVESWEGVFFSGGMEGDRDVGQKKVHFYFNADSIAKLESNTAIMERGTITSCDAEPNPHYHLKARKIWVLAPGEWAISNAVLYIGRVPVFWLPFFFRPGDEFFFHPAIGSREREGNFLQTTTYLIGQKKRSTSAISVLAATEEAGEQYPREIKGLFLRQKEGEQTPVKEGRILKVLLDYYSRLGVFTGVIGDFPPQVSFRAGLGVSRNIYPPGYPGNPSGTYTPFIPKNDSRSVWNKSWVFGAEVPFRYGTEAKWNLASGGYKLSGKFEFFSDPFFTTDFFNRAEETAVSRLIGLEPKETTTQVVETEKSGLSWELNGQADYAKLATAPYLKKISVPYFSGNLSWQSKYVDMTSVDPARKFYYPVSFKLPNAAVQFSGDLISIQPQAKAREAQGGPKPPLSATAPAPLPAELRLPEALPGKAPAEEPAAPPSGNEPSLRAPRAKENLQIPAAPVPASFLLSYQVRPAMVVEQSFNTGDWLLPSQVRYDLDYTSLATSGTSSLDWALKIYEQLLSVGGSLNVSGNYQTSFRESLGDTEWATRVDRDRRSSQALLRNVFTVALSPFVADPRFRATNLTYSLNWNVMRYLYDESASTYYGRAVYGANGPQWDTQTFSQHQLQATLGFQPGKRLNSLTLTSQLPPLNASLTAKGEFYVWLLKTTFNTVFREGTDTFPLSVQEVLELTPDVRFSQEIQADLAPGSFEKSITALNLWGLTSSFTAQRLASGSVEPSYVTVGYRLAPKEWYLWKNRTRAQIVVNSNWHMNLQNVVDNSFTFSFTFKYFIYQFLELSFTSTSYNNQTYLYFPSLAGVSYRNPVVDLLKSFNFFDTTGADRRDSRFKLKSILVEMIHHMHDWDLTFRYEGKPSLITDYSKGVGKLRYTWYDSFSILLQWIPIPEMRSNMVGDSTSGFSIRS